MAKALVLGGGGAKGAYHMGVWKALRKIRRKNEIVVGSSIGALVSTFYVQNEYFKAMKLWKNITIDQVIADGVNLDINFNSLMSKRDKLAPLIAKSIKEGGVDVSPLKKIIAENINIDKLQKSKLELYCVTVEIPSYKLVEVNLKAVKDRAKDYLLASASCFPAFPICQIGDKRYIDGGFYDNLPVNTALRLGATDIIAVNLKAPGLIKKIPKTSAKITLIESYWPLGGFLNFDKDQVEQNIRIGYLDTLKAFDKYQGFAYTFKNDIRILDKITQGIQKEILDLNCSKDIYSILEIQLALSKQETKFLERLNKTTSDTNVIFRLIEKLMELYSFDNQKVYKLKNTVKDLRDKVTDIDKVNIDLIENGPSTKAIKELSKLNEVEIIGYFVKMIKENKLDRFSVIAKIFKDECLMAILINYLQKS